MVIGIYSVVHTADNAFCFVPCAGVVCKVTRKVYSPGAYVLWLILF